ncbi:MAG: transketolase [Candidatus Doudnabacteria bacterium]|nr:transketolase [Candidatus Doudnabacteria bacterium]
MNDNLEKLAKLLRYYSLVSTAEAGSGHPSSSLSGADLMAILMYGGYFRFDLEHPDFANNDRLIFSKGHASPLYYALWAVAGKVSEKEILSLRKFGSRLEGHPTMEFPFTEVPTGSLGQGLSVGVGMALNAKLDKLSYSTFVLLGDSEMAEGSVWEAMASASYYKLNNLVAILDCNRLGQRGETMYGHHLEVYKQKAEAFGWQTEVIDGHDLEAIKKAYQQISKSADKPLMIIAKTLKGKGISFIEDRDGWHGKALSADELKHALDELGEIDKNLVGEIAKPMGESPKSEVRSPKQILNPKFTNYQTPSLNPSPNGGGEGARVATRKAYGNALVNLVEANPNIVVLDAEVSNSTYAEFVKKSHPERFFEMFIAEQNMVGAALGFSRRGKIPFVSTFAAFFSRAFDQIRMSQYAKSNIKFVGSHAGVSIGEDGASQMGLEELAMFRTLLDSVVLYPSDAISTEKLVWEAAKHHGNVYIQTTRKDTAVLYNQDDNFSIGGSKTIKSSSSDVATVIGAGITVHETLAAYEELKKEGVNIRVIDLYSVKPIDSSTLEKAAQETKAIITVEDSYPEGGIGEAVSSVVSGQCSVHSLAVRRMPKSGKPEELLAYEEIDRAAIIKKIKELV